MSSSIDIQKSLSTAYTKIDGTGSLQYDSGLGVGNCKQDHCPTKPLSDQLKYFFFCFNRDYGDSYGEKLTASKLYGIQGESKTDIL